MVMFKVKLCKKKKKRIDNSSNFFFFLVITEITHQTSLERKKKMYFSNFLQIWAVLGLLEEFDLIAAQASLPNNPDTVIYVIKIHLNNQTKPSRLTLPSSRAQLYYRHCIFRPFAQLLNQKKSIAIGKKFSVIYFLGIEGNN